MNAKTCVTKSKFTFEENMSSGYYILYIYILSMWKEQIVMNLDLKLWLHIFFSFYMLNDLILKENLRITSKLFLISVYFHLYLQKYIDLYIFIYNKHKHEQTYVCIYVWSENIRLPFMRPLFDIQHSQFVRKWFLMQFSLPLHA